MLRGAGGLLETDDWHACVLTGVLIQTLFGHLLPLISAHEVEVSVLICLLFEAAQAGSHMTSLCLQMRLRKSFLRLQHRNASLWTK